MKYRIVAACLVLAGCLVNPAQAQDDPAAAPSAEALRARRARRGPREDGRNVLGRLLRDLQLTADQQTRVREIMETQRQALENWRRENEGKFRELRRKLAELVRAGQADQAKAVREEMRKLVASRRELHLSLMKRLSGVLDESQMARLKEAMARIERAMWDRWLGSLRRLQLTDAQGEQVRRIMEGARAEASQTDDPQEKAEILREAMEKVRSDILTDEQRRRLAGMAGQRRGGRDVEMLRGLDLTETQRDRIRAIAEEFRGKFDSAADPEQRRELMRQRREQIAQVLTEEQRQQLRRRMAPGRGGRPRRERSAPVETD